MVRLVKLNRISYCWFCWKTVGIPVLLMERVCRLLPQQSVMAPALNASLPAFVNAQCAEGNALMVQPTSLGPCFASFATAIGSDLAQDLAGEQAVRCNFIFLICRYRRAFWIVVWSMTWTRQNPKQRNKFIVNFVNIIFILQTLPVVLGLVQVLPKIARLSETFQYCLYDSYSCYCGAVFRDRFDHSYR